MNSLPMQKRIGALYLLRYEEAYSVQAYVYMMTLVGDLRYIDGFLRAFKNHPKYIPITTVNKYYAKLPQLNLN